MTFDKRLAAQVPGIDAIIGGHSHTFLPAPIFIHGPSGRNVPIVQAGEFGVMLGRLDLTFTREDRWRLTAAKGRLILLDKTFPEDAAMKKLLAHYNIF